LLLPLLLGWRVLLIPFLTVSGLTSHRWITLVFSAIKVFNLMDVAFVEYLNGSFFFRAWLVFRGWKFEKLVELRLDG
jgi:hypothetical protein